jgi:ribonuclease P protein component
MGAQHGQSSLANIHWQSLSGQQELGAAIENGELVRGDSNQSARRAVGVEVEGQGFPRTARLLKHSDFDRVYKQGRRHFSPHMTVFYLARPADVSGTAGTRVGFTVGRVLGGAVDRNRIKRRLREAVRLRRSGFEFAADVVINPKKSVLTVEFQVVLEEVGRAFDAISKALKKKKAEE